MIDILEKLYYGVVRTKIIVLNGRCEDTSNKKLHLLMLPKFQGGEGGQPRLNQVFGVERKKCNRK